MGTLPITKSPVKVLVEEAKERLRCRIDGDLSDRAADQGLVSYKPVFSRSA